MADELLETAAAAAAPPPPPQPGALSEVADGVAGRSAGILGSCGAEGADEAQPKAVDDKDEEHAEERGEAAALLAACWRLFPAEDSDCLPAMPCKLPWSVRCRW